jgi:predicted amidohydrolase
MRIAVVQLGITDAEPPAARLARVRDLIGQLAGRADLVVLPELWLTGAFATRAAIEHAETLDGPTWKALADVAAEADVHLLAGSLSEAGGSRAAKPYNTAIVFGPDGSRQAVYRKIHLFGFDGGEADAFAAGSVEPVVWDSPWGRFGLATCYDLRFPELFRALVDAGAEGFLVPTGWPAKRIERWDVLAQARAIENLAWFVGVNAVGAHAGATMGGRSMVVDPTGDVVYRGSDDAEETPCVDIDPAAVVAWRERFPALRDRRIATPRR